MSGIKIIQFGQITEQDGRLSAMHFVLDCNGETPSQENLMNCIKLRIEAEIESIKNSNGSFPNLNEFKIKVAHP